MHPETIHDVVVRTGGYPVHCVHRGGAPCIGPENTLQAYRRAVELGARLLEVDVRLTRDAHCVLCHDAAVNRCTEGRGFVCDYTLAELRELDAAHDMEAHPVEHCCIPTLQEFLQEFVPHDDLLLMLDFKDIESVRAAQPLLAPHMPGLAPRLLLGGIFADVNAALHALPSAAPVLMSVARVFQLTIAFHLGLLGACPMDPARDMFGYILRPETRAFWTPPFVAALHKRGLRVMVCGSALDTEEGVREQVAWGVDYVMTDRPDVARRVFVHDDGDK